MPPEPLVLDRKDFFKHEQSESPSLPCYHGSHELARCESDSYRRTPGQSKQGWYVEVQSRDKMPEEESASPSLGTRDRKYVRSIRENRESSYSHVAAEKPFVVNNDLLPVDDLLKNNWKPLSWNRSASLSSCGSGYSNSSSMNTGSARIDSSEARAGFLPQSLTSTQSPVDDVAGGTSGSPSVETISRKKPRLGWGQGLAKYEKKKVEGYEECPSRNGLASPRVTDFSGFASPATPSSAACNSSPGMENRTYVKEPNTDYDMINTIDSPGSGLQNCLDGLSFNLETLDKKAMGHICYSLTELLQPEIAVESNFGRSTAINKLLVWKKDISKALEFTESEIDSLENDLRSLKAEIGNHSSLPAVSSFVHVQAISNHCEANSDASSLLPSQIPLQRKYSRDDMILEKALPDNVVGEFVHSAPIHEDIESPGTATSQYFESFCFDKGALSSDMVKHAECPGNLDKGRFVHDVHNLLGESTYFFAFANSLLDDTSIPSFSKDVTLSTYKDDASLCDRILVSNKESAYKASEVFNQLLPVGKCLGDNLGGDNLGAANVSSCHNDLFIRRNFASRKRFLRFKERILTLKYRALQHIWKEDVGLLNQKKNRAKYQKQIDIGSHAKGFQKYRSSIRSRFCSSGILNHAPNTEMIDFTSKLLLAPGLEPCRKSLKMPALILDKKEKLMSRFISRNGLVEDPCAVEKERDMVNPWTAVEKKIFMDNLTAFGKDFGKIASFLDHKTTADCVEFYYKNHKSDSFEKKEKPENRKQGKHFSANTYMLTSGNKRDREMNAISLDLLGEASVMASHSRVGIESNIFDVVGNERETAAAYVLAGICGSISSEAVGSCIQNDDGATCSDDSSGEMDTSEWTDGEKSIFIQALSSYGKDFPKISQCIRTRSTDQCKIFFSKARKCLGLDNIYPVPSNVGTSVSEDAYGSGSDTGNTRVVQTDSLICNNKSSSVLKGGYCASDLEKIISLHTDLNMSDAKNETKIVDHRVSVAVESSIIDACPLEDRPELIVFNGVGHESLLTHVRKGEVISSAIDIETETSDPCTLTSDAKIEGAQILFPENYNGQEGLEATSPPARVGDSANSKLNTPMELDSNQISLSISQQNPVLTEVSVSKDCGFVQNASTLAQESSCVADHYPLVSGHPLSKNIEPSQILRGYPLQLPIKKEMNGDIIGLKASAFPSLQTVIAHECYLKKCNSSKSPSSITDLQLSPKNLNEVSHQHPRADLQSSQDLEKPCNNGDFKLFGKILSHPPLLQKVSSVTQEKDEEANNHPKSSCNIINLKLTSHQNIDGLLTFSKFDKNNYLGLENFATKSCGFWDTSRLQTGFTAVPDSTVLRPLQAVAKSNKGNMNDVSVFPTIEADYQVYNKNQDGNKLQMIMQQQRQDLLSENGFGGVSTLQQQGRGIVEKNVLGGGSGILVGGPCTPPVPDAVAAFKINFHKAEQ